MIIGAVTLLAIALVIFIPFVRSSIIVGGRTVREHVIHAVSTAPEPLDQPKYSMGASGAPSHRGTAPDAGGSENVLGAFQSTPISQNQANSTDVESQALNLWVKFDSSEWGASLQDWSKLHPDSSCERFGGRAGGQIADREWSHRCSTGRGLEAAHWSFYIFDLQEPLVPRLEEFEVMSSELPEESLGLVQSSLQARLTSRYGPGEDRSPKLGRMVFWPQYLRWKTPDLEIQLNFSTLDGRTKQGHLQLQARHRALLDASKDDERLRAFESDSFIYGAGSSLAKQLVESLRSDFPDVATMLVKSQPDSDPQQMREAVERFQSQLRAQAQQQAGMRAAPGQIAPRAVIFAVPQRNWKAEEFHEALVRLLTSAKTSAAEQRPILLLAADQLAGRLPNVIENDKSRNWDWSQWRNQLAGFGVTYSPGVESLWTYGGDLLKRVSMDYSDTVWGEHAFLALLRQGWEPAEGCTTGTDQFRKVVQQGLPFLEKHPNSPDRFDVQLAVAQAYETWWSLSQAAVPGPSAMETNEDDEPDADPREYQQGAEAARQQAVDRYTQLLQLGPQDDYAIYAARQLPRLKSGVNTGQRRFYCIVED
jgi:hypothetical protein